MSQWRALLEEEGHPAVHLLSTKGWASNFHESMHIHNDGRAYAMVIRNDGEILWGSHDAFKEHLQEKQMVRVVSQECEWREEERQRLLQGATAGQASLPEGTAEET